jgi:hypothetical protein
MGRMRSELHRNLPISAAYRYKQPSCTDGSSTVSVNMLASEQMLLGDGEISFRHNITQWEDIVCVATSSAGSSLPLGDWHPATGRINDHPIMGGEPSPSLQLELNRDHPFMWEEKREKRQTELSEVELMKERFAKLLLGDDMSGGAKGVCTALAISNAITNLSGSMSFYWHLYLIYANLYHCPIILIRLLCCPPPSQLHVECLDANVIKWM